MDEWIGIRENREPESSGRITLHVSRLTGFRFHPIIHSSNHPPLSPPARSHQRFPNHHGKSPSAASEHRPRPAIAVRSQRTSSAASERRPRPANAVRSQRTLSAASERRPQPANAVRSQKTPSAASDCRPQPENVVRCQILTISDRKRRFPVRKPSKITVLEENCWKVVKSDHPAWVSEAAWMSPAAENVRQLRFESLPVPHWKPAHDTNPRDATSLRNPNTGCPPNACHTADRHRRFQTCSRRSRTPVHTSSGRRRAEPIGTSGKKFAFLSQLSFESLVQEAR